MDLNFDPLLVILKNWANWHVERYTISFVDTDGYRYRFARIAKYQPTSINFNATIAKLVHVNQYYLNTDQYQSKPNSQIPPLILTCYSFFDTTATKPVPGDWYLLKYRAVSVETDRCQPIFK